MKSTAESRVDIVIKQVSALFLYKMLKELLIVRTTLEEKFNPRGEGGIGRF